MPETESVHAKFTVTAELFQPAGLAVGVRVPEITGAVLSIFTGPKLTVETFPAVSMQVPVTAWPVLPVSLEIVTLPIG
jgi:hypothetical protein